MAFGVAILLVSLVLGITIFTVAYQGTATDTSTSTRDVTNHIVQNDTTTVTTQAVIGVLKGNGSESLCGIVFRNGLQIVGNETGGYSWQERLFLMPASSTATICVSYNSFQPGSTWNSSLAAQDSAGRIEVVNATYSSGGYSVNSIDTAKGITDKGVPYLLMVGNQTYPVMVYTITAGAGTAGIYELWYPSQCPPWIPLSVGYTIAQAQSKISSGGSVFTTQSGCTASADQSDGRIVGFGGTMSVDWTSTG